MRLPTDLQDRIEESVIVVIGDDVVERPNLFLLLVADTATDEFRRAVTLATTSTSLYECHHCSVPAAAAAMRAAGGALVRQSSEQSEAEPEPYAEVGRSRRLTDFWVWNP